jgi:nitrous oxide reductase accessory protein NosL
MAYPYYAPFYRPTYYDQMQTPSFNQQPMAQPVQQIQTPAQQTNNGLVWVQGETGAKSYLVAPGCTVMLMDSEGERFYLKSADASGMPLPLRVFEYKERTETAQQTAGGSVAAFDDLDNKFVTRDEFERRMASIAPQKKSKNKLTEDAEDGDTTI